MDFPERQLEYCIMCITIYALNAHFPVSSKVLLAIPYKQETKELYVKGKASVVSLRYKLRNAFRSSCKPPAEKIKSSKLTNVEYSCP